MRRLIAFILSIALSLVAMLPASALNTDHRSRSASIIPSRQALEMHRDDGSGLAYAGDMVFTRNSAGTYTFETSSYCNGRLLTDGSTQKFVTDHLGSVRAVVVNGQVVERNDYYPFGLRHPNTAYPTLSSNRYGYNGKELQSPTSSGSYLDYGARFLDPAIGRWTTQDPMAEKYLSLTPYNFCGNDGVNFVDPDGQVIETLWDAANVVLDIKSLKDNLRQHNYGAATIDAAGLVLDAAAVLVPGLPGGIGTELKLIRQSDSAIDFVNTTATIGKDLHRPYIRKSTRKAIESVSIKDNLGRYIDPNTNMPIEGRYDLGHIHGREYRTEKRKAINDGLSQKEFNDRMNNPSLYQIEDPKSNRSHKYEKR